MASCKHQFERLNDRQVFCSKCGDFRTAPEVALPQVLPVVCGHYHCWCGEHHLTHPYPYVYPSYPWGTWSVSTSAPEVTITSVSSGITS